MKARMTIATLLLGLGFGLLLLLSGAPAQVNIWHGLTWIPTTLVVCTIYWNASLNPAKKATYILLTILTGALLAVYVTNITVSKFEYNITSVVYMGVFLILISAATIAITSTCASVMTNRKA